MEDSLGGRQFVCPGDVIVTEPGFLWGHGTRLDGDVLRATVAGLVERVNKLLCVRPLAQRYVPEIGDVVVGRISEVGDKRWKVDLNTRQDGILQLSSIHLPGGVQRRRTAEDSLQMRNFFVENDLISAEVQNFFHDGSVSLHTRSEKYGRLRFGQFVRVQQALVKRCKQHFVSLPCGVDMVLGNNGYVWLQPPVQANNDVTGEENVAKELRERIARLHNCIVALNHLFVPIYPDTIMDAYNESVELGLACRDIVSERAQMQRVVQKAASRLAGQM